MAQFDYIIVGQGIAGTLLTYRLRRLGKRVAVWDKGHERAASRVAAGIINPVTGRRFVKSWLVDRLLPEAERTYRELESHLGKPFYHPQPLFRAIHNRGEETDWLLRNDDPAYQTYLSADTQTQPPHPAIEPAYAYGRTHRTAQVDLPNLIGSFREMLKREGALFETPFLPDQLEIKAPFLRYGALEAHRIVFCEGYRGRANPWFGYLPFRAAKGEALEVSVPDFDLRAMVKQRVFLVPRGAQRYWIGSAYELEFEDDTPTEEGRTYLADRLSDCLRSPYKIIAHRAAIRPTVADRRPFLGQHPQHDKLFIFNGLGTKGASLTPYFSKQMAAFLEEGGALLPEVDIKRFAPSGGREC